MGLLPLMLPPKPQPYENTKRFVRPLPLIVFLGSPFRRTRGKLEQLRTQITLLCCKVVCPAGVGPGGKRFLFFFKWTDGLPKKLRF